MGLVTVPTSPENSIQSQPGVRGASASASAASGLPSETAFQQTQSGIKVL